MSASLLRGLRILEMLRTEPLGVSEVARRLGVDKAGVSRVLHALLQEGWVERMGRLHVLGPRAMLLHAHAHTTPELSRAGMVARRLREDTGQSALVIQLRGRSVQPLAFERSETMPAFTDLADPFEHLWASAAGLALLSQLPSHDLAPHLDLSPWPSHGGGIPAGPDEVHALLGDLRLGVPVVERSWTMPGLGGLALPWANDTPGTPSAIALVGPEPEITRDHDRLAELLRAAVEDVA